MARIEMGVNSSPINITGGVGNSENTSDDILNTISRYLSRINNNSEKTLENSEIALIISIIATIIAIATISIITYILIKNIKQRKKEKDEIKKLIKELSSNQTKDNERNTLSEKEMEKEMNRCQICGDPSGIYQICKSCQKDIEDGKVKICKYCGKFYIANQNHRCGQNDQQNFYNSNQQFQKTPNYNQPLRNEKSTFRKAAEGTVGVGCGVTIFITILTLLGFAAILFIIYSITK